LFIWLVIIALVKIALIALTAKLAATYATIAPNRARLQQVNGERPLNQPIKLKPKKHITALLTAIERTRNGIPIYYFLFIIYYFFPTLGALAHFSHF